VESYWIDYAMRVPCEVPRATTANTLDTLTALERQLECGDISPEVSSGVGTHLVPNLLDTLTLAYADSKALLEQAVLGCCR